MAKNKKARSWPGSFYSYLSLSDKIIRICKNVKRFSTKNLIFLEILFNLLRKIELIFYFFKLFFKILFWSRNQVY